MAKKRKLIDLEEEVILTLSVKAATEGKSIKSYIESILISRADQIKIEKRPNTIIIRD